ncbi:hypothetical protein PTKIN_Ptkin16aG0055400 [Pterospermum kingtungense]
MDANYYISMWYPSKFRSTTKTKAVANSIEASNPIMAANSALQYAAGISVPGCQLRRNLVTKSLKTTIMASNPAMPSETNALVSMPPQLQRNSVCTRRNKTVVAAYPDLQIEVKTIITPGVPEYTNIVIENHGCGSEPLKLDDKNFWEGSQYATPPKLILRGQSRRFVHRAGSGGSIGALEYIFPEDKYKLIIAWSNAKDDLNKVYTVILRDDANWHEIKGRLDISGHRSAFNGLKHGIPYSSKVEIHKTSPTPTLKAKVHLAPAPLLNDADLTFADEENEDDDLSAGNGTPLGVARTEEVAASANQFATVSST